jgi:hypothetical protein
MTTTTTTNRLDQTHIGLRVALLAIFFASLGIGACVSIAFIDNVVRLENPFNILAIFTLTVLIALGTGWAAEKFLTRNWPSGKTLQITNEGLVLTDRSSEATTIRWDAHINVISWHFRVRKGRAWVPKGAYCLACQLKQDDSMMVLYAFLKPSIAEELPKWKAFSELLPRKGDGKDHEHQLSEIGEQAPLRYAEQDRWHHGAEMAPDDFIKLLSELAQHVPDWR